MNISNKWYEALGWIGIVLILGGYGLLALGILDAKSLIYHGATLAGSIMVGLISAYKKVYQPAVLNGLFAVFALIAIIRITTI